MSSQFVTLFLLETLLFVSFFCFFHFFSSDSQRFTFISNFTVHSVLKQTVRWRLIHALLKVGLLKTPVFFSFSFRFLFVFFLEPISKIFKRSHCKCVLCWGSTAHSIQQRSLLWGE